ncbi:hypothetical protein [Bradyrhizobium liaoningense]|uniref:hypothetical protein n=1 Tax=Bradyrhizobium liaoningense TaxID=43992 RepID=UPI001BACBCAB|nr:hypothetical protein [Bradyrhizobium liaoningense]MBR0713077.1 hypothetical protein [Bradyrhizobium liaoningense]
MFEFAWLAFNCVALVGFAFFAFVKRDFDFLAIAYVGAMFYFAPLFWGQVQQLSPELTSTIQPAVYWIATAYVLGLVLAGAALRSFSDSDELPFGTGRADVDTKATSRPTLRLSVCYLILAVIGLLGSLISTNGGIITADKVQALNQVGYFYVLFEVAASLSCIAAVVERRWLVAAASAVLLLIDLLVGFRAFVILTCIGVALVRMMPFGRIRLYSKIPTYGVAAFALLACMLLVHSARFAIFDRIAVLEGVPPSERITRASEMRGDTIQFGQATTQPGEKSDESTKSTMPKWLSIPLGLFEQSEPFVIQATLVSAVQKNLSCSTSNIFKSIYLLVPPGLTRYLPSTSFPPTFYDEYKPILYPNITYGTGGNIWAEMLCRFGYGGVAIFCVLLILALVGLHRLLLRCPSAAIAPVALGGVVIAFYIHRNDLHYTLVMLRQTAIVFVLACGLSVVGSKIQRSLRGETGVRA